VDRYSKKAAVAWKENMRVLWDRVLGLEFVLKDMGDDDDNDVECCASDWVWNWDWDWVVQ
jgi:hypothetical protein